MAGTSVGILVGHHDGCSRVSSVAWAIVVGAQVVTVLALDKTSFRAVVQAMEQLGRTATCQCRLSLRLRRCASPSLFFLLEQTCKRLHVHTMTARQKVGSQGAKVERPLRLTSFAKASVHSAHLCFETSVSKRSGRTSELRHWLNMYD